MKRTICRNLHINDWIHLKKRKISPSFAWIYRFKEHCSHTADARMINQMIGQLFLWFVRLWTFWANKRFRMFFMILLVILHQHRHFNEFRALHTFMDCNVAVVAFQMFQYLFGWSEFLLTIRAVDMIFRATKMLVHFMFNDFFVANHTSFIFFSFFPDTNSDMCGFHMFFDLFMRSQRQSTDITFERRPRSPFTYQRC